jgi:hypothetical protein
MMIDPEILRLEAINSTIDYLKHLTALSTGSLVLIAIFWEKLSTKPVWKNAIAVSIGGFMLCILSSVFFHTYAIYAITRPSMDRGYTGYLLHSTWFGFLAGISGLVIFALKNILRKTD